MDVRDLIMSNGYPGFVFLPFGQAHVSVLSGSNWGNPQPVAVDAEVEFRSDFLKRRIRRKLMSDLASEFAVLHDDLLRELAR
jgi:hypothetical protein